MNLIRQERDRWNEIEQSHRQDHGEAFDLDLQSICSAHLELDPSNERTKVFVHAHTEYSFRDCCQFRWQADPGELSDAGIATVSRRRVTCRPVYLVTSDV